ncbi:hypothetical protein PF007_g26921 [Phytophthora fragariae]|uniref:Uncharacterized protein n=1 Tax=Phytophthora fragariae TaxID=53985 RepID=A0A6A3Q7J0_9STRA|nr:hypothetical protein PF003_g39017 [Phytophthora fragariae]KAE8886821.1 hypothetical protein PF003_g29101 [Phytophthora fragariae]KAE8896517.1 hypothetical protein PF003_g19217 [Phytophthora fragariae]KAE9070497.1 hypothetical protein PF007_g26921 [Phytophthora fragariae]KAE9272185.1 hypothetical protein PF001_g28052 [Phytophthora fragariae]
MLATAQVCRLLHTRIVHFFAWALAHCCVRAHIMHADKLVRRCNRHLRCACFSAFTARA